LPVHQRRHEGRVRRTAERLREPDHERERQDDPYLDVPRQDQSRESGRARHLHDLGSEEDPPAVHAVPENPAEEGERQEGRLAEERVEPEERRRAGHREDQPVLRHLLHPRSYARREGTRPHQAKVAVRERLEGSSQSRDLLFGSGGYATQRGSPAIYSPTFFFPVTHREGGTMHPE